MFFKKSREAKEAKALEENRQIAAKLRTALTTAETAQDMGEKLILLDNLKTELAEQSRSLESRHSSAVEPALTTSLLGIVLGGPAAAAATGFGIVKLGAVLALVPLATVASIPAAIAAGLGASFGIRKAIKATIQKSADERVSRESKELSDTIEELGPKVYALRTEALNSSLDAFASSKMFDTVYERFPSLKDRFVKEAFRKDRSPAPPQADPPSPSKKPALNP